MWTVALTCSGNALGLTYDEYKALSLEALAEERARIGQMFEGSRPHYLIDTIAELPAVIDDINKRLARGEMPQAC
ncbi:Phosphonoacetaldehyde hydrolase [compost metagenome]